MGNKFSTKEFKELQEYWYAVLKATGFQDAEKNTGRELVLTQKASNVYRQASKVVRESKAAYYNLLTYHFYKTSFDNEVDRYIMLRTSEGAKRRQVSKELHKLKCKCHVQTIMYVVRYWEDRWGIRSWNKKQLTSRR